MLHTKAIQEALSLDSLPIDALLALRIAFDDPLDIVDLDQDVFDLQNFPERLDASYRYEWQAYVTRAIAKLCNHNKEQSVDNILEQIEGSVDDAKKNQKQRFDALIKVIKRTQDINASSDVVPFPHHLRQQLDRLLK